MEETNRDNINKNYISLIEASKLCSYSEPYLRLRARQGKLKSIKLGKKWMTTPAWLDDYAARVQEWRELSEAKKNNQPAATLVSAPLELSGNLERNDLQENESPAVAGPKVVFADNAGVDAPVAVFCAASQPALPPRRRRLVSFAPAGQIFPVPKQTDIDSVSSFGWFGALLSGAGCALALFLAVNYGDSSNIFNADSGRIGQANARQAVLSTNREDSPAAVLSSKNDFQNLFFRLPRDMSLKDLVDHIERFLENR